MTNPTTKDRLATAQWILERNLAWIAAADVKVAVIATIDIGMLGGLAAAFGLPDAHKTPWALFFVLATSLCLVTGLAQAARSLSPRRDGPKTSLVFFGRIAELEQYAYVEKLRDSNDEQLLEDWSQQIHRNAEIACTKFILVQKAMVMSFIAVSPWIIAIVLLVKG